MNLAEASKYHQNMVTSFASIFAILNVFGGLSDETQKSVIGWLFFVVLCILCVWHGVSIFKLGKSLGKNKVIWVVTSFVTPFFFFIPSALLMISANKTFKANGWKVRFYGGAVPRA